MGGNAFVSFPSAVGAVGGWVELARTTLGSNNANITVSSIPDKRYYLILNDFDLTGAGTGGGFRLGNSTLDAAGNYARRQSSDGGGDVTPPTPQTELYGVGGFTDAPEFWVNYIANISGDEKLAQSWRAFGLTGASNAPKRVEQVAKWVNTSNPLDIVGGFQGGADQFTTGSEIVVLGWDPADVHTTNFWEELDSTDFSGSADDFTSSTFPAKKYLWVQCYLEGTASMRPFSVQFNSDTGPNYAIRRSSNSSGDSPFGSTTSIDGAGGQDVTNMFWNMFIINKSANEKLCIIHSVSVVTQGSGTAPRRDEIVGKWGNTSSQITSITVRDGDSGKITTGKLRVWGSN